jgi:hypothetical protein
MLSLNDTQSFVPNAAAHGVATAVGRCTLFEITTKEFIDLSELHHDIMHVLLAWLSQTLAESTKTMIAPLLSPTTPSAPAVFWEPRGQVEGGDGLDKRITFRFR